MANSKRIEEKTVVQACKLADKGVDRETIIDLCGIGKNAMVAIRAARETAQTGKELESFERNYNFLPRICEIVCNYYGKNAEDFLPKKEPKAESEEPKAVPAGKADQKPMDELTIQQLLIATKEQNELMIQMMDTVLPKYFNDLTAIVADIRKASDKIAAIEELRESFDTMQNCSEAILNLLVRNSGNCTETALRSAMAKECFSSADIDKALESLMKRRKVYKAEQAVGNTKLVTVRLK